MKKISTILLLLAVWQLADSQQPMFVNNPFPKTISVSGSASLEVIPDEIFVDIELQEYQKRGESKKDMETIKRQFFEATSAAGVPDSAISILSYSGSNDYFHIRKRKKNEELNASITYQVKFNNTKSMDNLVDRLDENATLSFSIVSVSHSRITQLRQDLKIMAVKAAKEKAVRLTESIGEKLGEAITITEPWEWNPYQNNLYANSNISLANSNISLSDETKPTDANVDFKKMKLKFDVSVIFALK